MNERRSLEADVRFRPVSAVFRSDGFPLGFLTALCARNNAPLLMPSLT